MTDPIGGAYLPEATLPTGPLYDPLEGLRVGLSQQQRQAQTSLDPQAFLQLLVAQLQYQDPTNPADTSEFMNQTAMLSQVQSMDAMANSVFEMISAQQVSTATTMIGKAVSYVAPNGEQATGVVTSVSMHSGVPLLHVGDVAIPLAGVLEVADAVSGGENGGGTGGIEEIPDPASAGGEPADSDNDTSAQGVGDATDPAGSEPGSSDLDA